MPVTAEQLPFATQVAEQMQQLGVRVVVDRSGERLGKMVRNSEKAKIPVMAVIGAKEVDDNSLSIRTRQEGDLGAIAVPDVITRVKAALDSHGYF